MPRTGLQKERRATGDYLVDCRAGLLSRSVYTARLFSRSLISTPGPILLGMTTFGLQPMRPRPSAAGGSHTSGLGQPPFDPQMMTGLLLHSYASGLYSSRRIARATVERADFMMIVAGDPRDFRTISDFRKRQLKALAALFVQVLKLAEKAGLVKLRRVALDGTKIKANASKHKAMSYERMKKREAELQAEVDRWLVAAEAADAEEDKLYGQKRGDEMTDWMADNQRRLEKIREAKAELEAEARAAAAEETRRREEAEKKRIAEGRKNNGKTPTPPKQEPEGKTQRNFTDPESRVLLTKDGYIQGYNAQAAVDAEAQIIVAHGLTQSMSDQDQLVALVDGIKKNLGRKRKEASADAGYCSEANLGAPADRGIGAYVATGRAKHPAQAERKRGGPRTQAMRDKLKRAGGEAATGSEIKWSSRCSDRSNRQERSDSSCYAASTK